MSRSLGQRLSIVSTTFILIVAIGTLGYRLIERWSFFDAFYMTAITLTTVGFGEVHPLSGPGRVFTIILLFIGLGNFAYGLSTLGEYLLTTGLAQRLRKRQLARMKQLINHTIVCGAGRVGYGAAESLAEMKRPFVFTDNDPTTLVEANNKGWLTLEGDATRDETLLQAGIQQAASLLVCTGSDSDNLFIVLSARALAPKLFIVARCVELANEAKMRRAGANKVISPYRLGGRQMVNVALRPTVAEFMDVVTLDNGLELWLEEITIAAGSPLAGQTAFEANIRRRTGATLVALMRQTSHTALTPDENTRLEAGDHLIVLGTRQQLQALEEMAGKGSYEL